MKYRALIFDLDGTLIDSFQDIVESWNAALIICGLPSFPHDAFRKPLKSGKQAVLEMIVPKSAPPTLGKAVLSAYKGCYRKNWNRHTTAFPQVNEALEELHNRGIKCAVLSNKSQELVDLCCRAFLFTDAFSVVRGASDRYPLKPAPEQALDVSRVLGAAQNETAMIGDSLVDLATAKNSGFNAFFAEWGGRCDIPGEATYPFTILSTPKSILDHMRPTK